MMKSKRLRTKIAQFFLDAFVYLSLVLAAACGSDVFEAISVPPDSGTIDESPNTDTANDAHTGETDDTAKTVDTAILFEMMGYAAVEGQGHGPTTGGAGDIDPITVESALELQQAIDDKGSDPLTVYIDQRLTFTESGRILIKGASDISILGLNDRAELDGFGLSLSGAHNIIIQNLKIHHVDRDDGDAIRITDASHHIWIDHCELNNTGPTDDGDYDGLIDITRGSDYITVSWSHLHDSVKGLLVGHNDDNRDEDEGTFHITYHHNYLERIGSGIPSVRFGSVHVWNNYYRDIYLRDEGTGIAVSSRMGACVRVENNLFRDVYAPVITDQSGSDDESLGRVAVHDNAFIGHTELSESPTCTLTPPYEYEAALLAADSLSVHVLDWVGVGKVEMP